MYPYKNVLFLKNGVIYPYKIQKPKKNTETYLKTIKQRRQVRAKLFAVKN